MTSIILAILFIIRALIIWQLSELVHNISDKKLKGLALSGMLIYVAYIVYGVITTAAINPLVIFGLIGLFLVLLAVNKFFKKQREGC
ncbi:MULTISPECIES: hypothetical protein [Deinococcus]|uniref:Uncharacterized protein n=1 Tax=Deinococcus rufus TaxID=2136097 RepID=A0ABV7Z6T9_9DEIO|nr:hypothetical protein [Deinococcus sp. AB2017081]WQE94437.1 hypothetical protein U2P90_13610 [Deinococcus sp. AB2017081]